jgi:hypothetical protein
MTSEEAIGHMIDALNVLAVPHMVVGSLASNFHGVARSTQDADIVIQLGSTSVTALADQLGAEFVLDPQMSFETATGTIRHTIRVKAIAFLIELFHLSDDPYDQARFQRDARSVCLSTTPMSSRLKTSSSPSCAGPCMASDRRIRMMSGTSSQCNGTV